MCLSSLEPPGDRMPMLREEPLRRVRMSYDEWCALPRWPRTEWAAGEAVVSPDPTFRHQRIGRRTIELLEACLPDLVVEGR